MLHIVQVVMWGVAEKPQIFLDEEKAVAAYVECAGKYWDQRYSAYCEHHSLSNDSFASAQAFVNTIDVSEKSRINYWTLNEEEVVSCESENPLCGAQAEDFRHLAKGVAAIQTGLTRLLDDLSELTCRFPRMGPSPREEQTVDDPGKAVPAASAVRQEEPESDPATYTTPEWKAFVGTIKRLGSGSRNEFYLLHRDDWRQDIYSDRTCLEYWDWVADRIMKYKKRAEGANYSVIQDRNSPGSYRFSNPEGIPSEDYCDSEWEAWCAAALELESNCRDAAG